MKNSPWKELISITDDFDEVYIYGFGIAGKWLQLQLSSSNKVICFVESDDKKAGHQFNGTIVNSYKELSSSLKKKKTSINKSLLINTCVDINDIWDKAGDLGISKQIPLGLYLNDFPLCDVSEETSDFVNYTLAAVKESHKSYFIEKGLFLRSIDVLVTERCSMKCQDCSNLMQYYEKPKNIDRSRIINEIQEILSKLDHLFEIRLIGGEPFLNPDIYEIINFATGLESVSYVVLYTNATVKLDKDRLLTSSRNFNKLSFSITDYGEKLSRQLPQVKVLLDELQITYRIHLPEWWTDSGSIININRTEQELKELFQNCCGKNLFTLSDNKLYRCPFAANADRLNGVPHDTDNYVLVSEDREKIISYVGDIDYIPACRFCKGRSWDTPQIVPAIQTRKPITYKKY